jgi:hypothetical protein
MEFFLALEHLTPPKLMGRLVEEGDEMVGLLVL